MADNKREPVQFLVNTPVEVALEFAEGRLIDTAFGQKTMYSVTSNRVIFAEKELAVKINFLSPAVGECFWINKSQKWVGSGRKRSRVLTWEVSPNRPAIHEPAPNGQPSDVAAAVEATAELPETQLERQMRESVEVRQRAADNIRARLNLERKEIHVAPPPPSPETKAEVAANLDAVLPAPEPSKVQQIAETILPPRREPEPAGTPERYIWFPNLIEVCRSYTFKTRVADFEMREFFCSQKAECRPEDADLVSEKLYEFCKRQVMKAVAAETGRKTA